MQFTSFVILRISKTVENRNVNLKLLCTYGHGHGQSAQY